MVALLSTNLAIIIQTLFLLKLKCQNEFYSRVDLSKFKNTQIASGAICPKCLRIFENSNIGFYNCENNLDQVYSINIENEDFGVFAYIKSLKYNSYPIPENLIFENIPSSLLEIFPVDDNGGHTIQIVNTELCLFHDHTLSNTNTNNIISFFRPCNYSNQYFKFYFFKTLYTFPEYKIVGNAYIYESQKIGMPSLDTVLSTGSTILFTNTATGQLVKVPFLQKIIPTITQYWTSGNPWFYVQLSRGNWRVSVSVSDSNTYYYKSDIPYYFPINECQESKEYKVDIPIRRWFTDGDSSGSGDTMILFKVCALRNVIFKKIYSVKAWYSSDTLKESSYGEGKNLNSINGFKLQKGKCILARGNISYCCNTDLEEFSDVRSWFNKESNSYDALKVSYGCKMDDDLNIYLRYIASSATYKYDCKKGLDFKADIWDDSEIYDDWK